MGVALVAALFLSATGAVNLQQAFSQKSTSTTDKATIKVTGQASKTLEADQVTIMLATQTPSVESLEISSIPANQAKVIDAIKKAVDDENTTVSIGNSYINQYYSGPSTPSNVFTVYASVPITLDVDQFSDIAV